MSGNARAAPRFSRKLLLVLAAVELASFSLFAPDMGFYLDDWGVLSHSIHLGRAGLLEYIAVFLRETKAFYYIRPLDAIYFPALYWLCGSTPWRYHAVILLLETATALTLFHVLERVLRERSLAFMTTCLYICYPNHGATHYWYNAGFTPAMFFLAAAAYFHVLWIEKRRLAALGAGLACFAVGDLIYEAVFPLCPLIPLLFLLRGLRLGKTWRRSCREAAIASLPLLALALALFAYNVLIQRFFPQTFPRHIMLDAAFALKVLGKGLECSFTAIGDLFRRSLTPALHDLPWGLWIAAAAGISGLAAALPRRGSDGVFKAVSERVWLIGAALLFGGAYAPYAISADRYMPHIFDVQNRVNAAASLPAAMALAWGLNKLGENSRKAVFAALMAVFTIINWQSGWEWAQSWETQSRILDSIAGQLPAPGGAPIIVYLKDAPDQIGNAPVFSGEGIFDAALKDATQRQDVRGEDSHGPRGASPVLVYDFATGQLK